MGSSNPRLSVPRDPPVWCEAETGSAVNITPELPAEREETLSKHGRRRAVINPHPRMVGAEWPPGGGNKSGTAEVCFSPLSLSEAKAFFYWRKIFDFSAKRLAVCCAHNFAAGGKIPHWQPERYFSHAHVAVKNDPNFLTPAGGKLCKVFGGRPYPFIVNVILKPARTLAVAICDSRPSHINFASPGNLTPEAINYE